MTTSQSTPAEAPPRRWTQRRTWVIGLVAAATLTLVTFALTQLRESADDSLLSHDKRPAPSFELPDLRAPAQTVRVEPGVPSVVNVWASWCVPCRREMPALQAAHRDLGDRVRFIGINHQDARRDALDFVARTGVTYPSGFDPDGDVARSFGAFGLPTTYFVSRTGQIVATKTGEVTPEQLRSEIDALLSED
ncbi:redoxin family protein [Iamia majanohamensis]|uniref:Redoxin family protein n=1 Tax=Iamia majanohamensis TaxID=467976 RepID=A0AAE9YBD9_9ACTN|nr:redoxin domain-containing protein [Iamia majanohamensis]WCO68008.1 redoxin family protein [Iamia majanohamensis]